MSKSLPHPEPPRVPLVYVAGPYRAETREGVELHIQTARAVGLQVARKGWCPVIPHTMLAHLDAAAPSIADQFWLDATLELMRRCDAVLLLPGWTQSSGTRAEVAEAQRLGLPVFDAVDFLPAGDRFDGQPGLHALEAVP